MRNKKNVPDIRFKGFTEEWQEQKMAQIGSPFNGLSGKTKEDFGHGEARFITYMNVFTNPVADLCRTESVEIDNNQNSVRYGDILFTVSSETPEEVGMSSVWLGHENNIYLNSFCFGYRLNTSKDPYYMAYLLRSNSIREKIAFLAQGISRYNISKNKVMEIALPFPILNEQQAIGNYFQNIDRLINTSQTKLDKLKNIKKACLEKMFPRNGSTTPELRFKGFMNEWEVGTLGSTTYIYDGTHQTPNYKDCGIMFLSVENIRTLKSNKYISEEDFKRDFKVYPELGDVLMTRIGDIGTANTINTNELIAFYVSLALLKKKDLDPYFLKESIHSEEVRKGLWHRTLHIAFPQKINKNEIEKVVIKYPNAQEEQIRIGYYFKNLDDLIAKTEQQINKLKNIKKACLDKMFVNRED